MYEYIVSIKYQDKDQNFIHGHIEKFEFSEKQNFTWKDFWHYYQDETDESIQHLDPVDVWMNVSILHEGWVT